MNSLPKELVEEIFAKTGAGSMVDLCMLKLCCKDFLHIVESDYVYRHVSLEKFQLVPLSWFKGEKETLFLKRCKENGNSKILYREGMVQYFSYSLVELGLENLKKAALQNHNEARYVYCMLLMCCEDERGRKQGFNIFCSLIESDFLLTCRIRVKSFIRSMWVNNKKRVVENHKYVLCNNSETCDIEMFNKLSRTGWPSLEDEDASNNSIPCKGCAATYELGLFFNMFRI